MMAWTVKNLREWLSDPEIDENDEILIDVGYPMRENTDGRTGIRNAHEPMGLDTESFDGVVLIEL